MIQIHSTREGFIKAYVDDFFKNGDPAEKEIVQGDITDDIGAFKKLVRLTGSEKIDWLEWVLAEDIYNSLIAAKKRLVKEHENKGLETTFPMNPVDRGIKLQVRITKSMNDVFDLVGKSITDNIKQGG